MLMLHGSNPIPPVAITLTGNDNMYVEDINKRLCYQAALSLLNLVAVGIPMLLIMDQTQHLTVLLISGSVPSYVTPCE